MLTHLLSTLLLAASAADSAARFDAPVRLMAGEEFMGSKRYYPSPVMFDIDGDKVADMVIGDLMGNLTVSSRENGKWATPKPLTGADGKPLKFHNW